MPHWPMTHRIDRHWAGRFTFVLINSRYWWRKQKIHKWNWRTENFTCDTSIFSCMHLEIQRFCAIYHDEREGGGGGGERRKRIVMPLSFHPITASSPHHTSPPPPTHLHLYPFTSSPHTSVCLITPLCLTSLQKTKKTKKNPKPLNTFVCVHSIITSCPHHTPPHPPLPLLISPFPSSLNTSVRSLICVPLLSLSPSPLSCSLLTCGSLGKTPLGLWKASIWRNTLYPAVESPETSKRF